MYATLIDALAGADLGTQLVAVGGGAIVISATVWGLYKGWKLFQSIV